MNANRLRIFLLVLVIMPAGLSAQQNTSPATAGAATHVAPGAYYRLNFLIRELDEGKLVNQRAYTMSVPSDRKVCRLRSGTRIPVPSEKSWTYVDVGINLDVQAEEAPEGLQLEVTAEISSGATENSTTTNLPPAIRQVRSQGAVVAPVGKPTIVFTADDPASHHRFELEVTPVREK
jgi:hypothetical protein